MPTSLYEQFLAVGSVKSLLTGKDFSAPQTEDKPTEDQSSSSISTPKK